MNELVSILTELLSIPYVEEDSPVFDGSFMLVPYMAGGLQGDGLVQVTSTMLYIELFYANKSTCIQSAISVWSEICAQQGMTAEEPDYTYEAEAGLWRASIPVEMINNNEED